VSALDELDRLANEAFAGRVVRKDLVRQVKVGANVPVYVLEFLLGKYCASDDPTAIATGLEVVNQTLRANFIRPDESELAKATLKKKGQHRLIDKVDVRLVASEDKFWAHLQNFNDKYVHIPEVRSYPRGDGVPLRPPPAGRRVVAARPHLRRRGRRGAEAALLHSWPEADPGRRVQPR
jgi:ATP-dependent Lon protease